MTATTKILLLFTGVMIFLLVWLDFSPLADMPEPLLAPDTKLLAPTCAYLQSTCSLLAQADQYTYREFLDALMEVESGGDVNAIGDGGMSRGPYQIGKLFWRDGQGGDYDTGVTQPHLCEEVMYRYWKRYCPKALDNLDFETLVRTFNGGPRGMSKHYTIRHWLKVKAILERN
jgi:hypothetical protein